MEEKEKKPKKRINVQKKGRVGQQKATKILEAMGMIVIEANSGKKSEDFIVIDKNKKVFSVEVKNHKQINITSFLKQTKEQAARRKLDDWMLLVNIGKGYGWMILEKNKKISFAKE